MPITATTLRTVVIHTVRAELPAIRARLQRMLNECVLFAAETADTAAAADAAAAASPFARSRVPGDAWGACSTEEEPPRPRPTAHSPLVSKLVRMGRKANIYNENPRCTSTDVQLRLFTGAPCSARPTGILKHYSIS